jgi:hypothetical protein
MTGVLNNVGQYDCMNWLCISYERKNELGIIPTKPPVNAVKLDRVLERKRLISKFIKYDLKTHTVEILKYKDQLSEEILDYFCKQFTARQCLFTETHAYVRERKWVLLGTDAERQRYIRTKGKIGKSKYVRLEKEGEVREYDTLKEASMYLDCKPETISNYAYHKRKIAGYAITMHNGGKNENK